MFFLGIFNRSIKKRSILDILLQILSYLFKQSTDKNMNKTLVTIWSVSALVLTSCFSGGVLESIVNRSHTSLNTIEDVVNAKNISVAVRENSWIWWQFESYRIYKDPLDNNMLAIQHLVKVVNKTYIDDNKNVFKINLKLQNNVKYRFISQFRNCIKILKIRGWSFWMNCQSFFGNCMVIRV